MSVDFNLVEFDLIKTEYGKNSFSMYPTQWIKRTNAIGIVSKGDIVLKLLHCNSIEFDGFKIEDLIMIEKITFFYDDIFLLGKKVLLFTIGLIKIAISCLEVTKI